MTPLCGVTKQWNGLMCIILVETSIKTISIKEDGSYTY